MRNLWNPSNNKINKLTRDQEGILEAQIPPSILGAGTSGNLEVGAAKFDIGGCDQPLHAIGGGSGGWP